ncbi:hypothetical protein HZB02_06245 [Candidatus Woesearchaeota archaeon]|nr:hypothetical protein [Candidatus Woesearchaeota archaeon]
MTLARRLHHWAVGTRFNPITSIDGFLEDSLPREVRFPYTRGFRDLWIGHEDYGQPLKHTGADRAVIIGRVDQPSSCVDVLYNLNKVPIEFLVYHSARKPFSKKWVEAKLHYARKPFSKKLVAGGLHSVPTDIKEVNDGSTYLLALTSLYHQLYQLVSDVEKSRPTVGQVTITNGMRNLDQVCISVTLSSHPAQLQKDIEVDYLFLISPDQGKMWGPHHTIKPYEHQKGSLDYYGLEGNGLHTLSGYQELYKQARVLVPPRPHST